ncbi:MAG: hypothetical protein Q4D02_04875 [Clostridia bacterium]|nr:hypothetical protein [Clostridia bacterium]
MNLKIKIRYDGKTKLTLSCMVVFLIELLILFTLCIITQNRLGPLYLIISIFCLMISTISLYNLKSFKILNRILDQYDSIANKIVERHFDENCDISIARLQIELNNIDHDTKFYNRLFSPAERHLISIPQSSAHMCLDNLIKKANEKDKDQA